MTTLTLTPTQARRLAVVRQRLAGPRPPATRDGLLDVVRALRCLQLDPIRAVERSHLLVLWSRVGPYDPALLDELLWQERALFEYWAHAASIVLTEDFPIHQHWMHRFRRGQGWRAQTRDWLAANGALRDHVLAAVAERGPLLARDIEDLSDHDWRSSGWTNGRNVSRMLDILWTEGRLLVAGRQGIQRLWGLAEEHLPDWTPRALLTPAEVTRQAAEHALRALGIATGRQIGQHFTRHHYPGLPAALEELTADGQIIPAAIAGADGKWPGAWYVHAAALADLERLDGDGWQPRTTLLSPFDNLICDRARAEQLWGFHYRSEIYTPAAKRQYGYYVLPILHGERLVGRLNPRLDRRRRRLTVDGLFAAAEAPRTAVMGAAVGTAVAELAAFLDATAIHYTGSLPDGWRAGLALPESTARVTIDG